MYRKKLYSSLARNLNWRLVIVVGSVGGENPPIITAKATTEGEEECCYGVVCVLPWGGKGYRSGKDEGCSVEHFFFVRCTASEE